MRGQNGLRERQALDQRLAGDRVTADPPAGRSRRRRVRHGLSAFFLPNTIAAEAVG
jgi:hypothetical protein